MRVQHIKVLKTLTFSSSTVMLITQRMGLFFFASNSSSCASQHNRARIGKITSHNEKEIETENRRKEQKNGQLSPGSECVGIHRE